MEFKEAIRKLCSGEVQLYKMKPNSGFVVVEEMEPGYYFARVYRADTMFDYRFFEEDELKKIMVKATDNDLKKYLLKSVV